MFPDAPIGIDDAPIGIDDAPIGIDGGAGELNEPVV